MSATLPTELWDSALCCLGRSHSVVAQSVIQKSLTEQVFPDEQGGGLVVNMTTCPKVPGPVLMLGMEISETVFPTHLEGPKLVRRPTNPSHVGSLDLLCCDIIHNGDAPSIAKFFVKHGF